MKQFFLALYIFFFASYIFSTAQTNQTTQKVGNLTVIITGLENTNGDIQIGLFNSKESYNGKKKKFKGAIIKIKTKDVKWELKDIPFGVYAIKAFHDENSNDKIDTNFIGIPTESYGFSNNVKGFFGPPGFDKAKFKFNSNHMEIKITLK